MANQAATGDRMMDFYKAVYGQDHPQDGPHGWIQWKGTDVCIDLYCACGHHGHFDGDFLYYFECPACNAKYAVGQVVKLIPLTAKQAAHVADRLKTCELERD